MSNSGKTYFADTTVVYYKLHSHRLLKEAVRQAVGADRLAVSNFVRGEYIRGYVTGLIDLYSAIKEEEAVEDGLQVFSGTAGSRPRKLANAFLSLTNWLCGFEDWQEVPKTLRRLGEYIRLRLTEFDLAFPTRARDPLECEIGVLSFPKDSYAEAHLYDFLEEYERIREAPGCNQCGFRRDQEAKVAAAEIDFYSREQREAHKKARGYVKQAEWMEKALKSDLRGPSCWYCDRLGDTIIALSAPANTTVLTGDAQSFPVLTQLLGTPLQLILSLDLLRGQRKER